MTIGLPGVPDDHDLDLEERESSPAKRSKGAPASAAVTMESIRALLQEQSFSILQAQQAQISSSLKAFEERQSVKFGVLEQAVHTQGGEVQTLQGQLRDLAARVSKIETRPGVEPGVAAGPDRKHTLVFGGWGQNTRRATLLHQLQQALAALRLDAHLDSDPFCTGARCSVALCQFKRRSTEESDQPRARMMEIIQVVNSSKVTLEGGERALWCSFSKTPEERGRASLAAVVRKAVLRYAPPRMSDLDVEYPTGRTWMKEDQLTGMGQAPPEVRHPRVIETRAGAAWLDERTLAKWVDRDLSEVQGLISEHRF